LYQLALRRRSVRFYLHKKVEPHLIQEAMKIAALSPSACNRQAFKFLFFNEENIVEKISNVPLGIQGYKLPSIIVVTGSYRGYFDERDINAPIIDSSLAVMSFLFALETLNLSSVCINWANLIEKEQKIREIIELDKDEFIVMFIGVGYPSPEGKIPYSAKKEVKDLLLVNQRIKNMLTT
jgi:nitroreductase